tara:strand:- start:17580 stop:18281 length:702 start_codon:yes stop_codon:yes gene_type:complete
MKKWKSINRNTFISKKANTPPGFKSMTFASLYKSILKSYKIDNESYYEFADKETPVSKAEIVNTEDIVSLNASGVVAYIEIEYQGNISVESLTSDSYHLFLGQSKIIFLLFGKDHKISELFRYSGRLLITSATVKDINGRSVNTDIVDENVAQWNKIESSYDNFDKGWDESYTFNRPKNRRIKQKATQLSRQVEYAKYKEKSMKIKKFIKPKKKLIKDIIIEKNKRKGVNVAL